MPEAVLAIEASQRAASVAVRRAPGAAAVERAVPPPERDSDHLMAVIDACCREAGISARDLAAIAVSVGPGGFTGLRVACATAKALAEVGGCRLVAVPSALVAARAAAAEGTLPDGPCTVVLASKGGDAWCSLVEVAGGMPAERGAGLSTTLPAGHGPVLADEHAPQAWRAGMEARGLIPARWTARACLEAGESLLSAGTPVDALLLGPIYPRPPEAVTLWEARHGAGGQ
jgi:tRNA threonylcarbamoyladenosine biosynthesis protein TsaB